MTAPLLRSTTWSSSTSFVPGIEEKQFLKYEVEACAAQSTSGKQNPFSSSHLFVGPPFPSFLSSTANILESVLENGDGASIEIFEGEGVEVEWGGKGEVEVNVMCANLVLVVWKEVERGGGGEMKGYVRIPIDKMTFGSVEWHHIKMKKKGGGEAVVGLLKLKFTDLAPNTTVALGAIRAKALKDKRKEERKTTRREKREKRTINLPSSPPNNTIRPPEEQESGFGSPVEYSGTLKRKQKKKIPLFRNLSVREKKRDGDGSPFLLDQAFEQPPPSSPPNSPIPNFSPPPTRPPPPSPPNSPSFSPPYSPNYPSSPSSSVPSSPPFSPPQSISRSSLKGPLPNKPLPPLPPKSSSSDRLLGPPSEPVRTPPSFPQQNSPDNSPSHQEGEGEVGKGEGKGGKGEKDGEKEREKEGEREGVNGVGVGKGELGEEDKENKGQGGEEESNQEKVVQQQPKKIHHPRSMSPSPMPPSERKMKGQEGEEEKEEMAVRPLPTRGKSPPPSSPPPSILLSPTFRSRSPPGSEEKEKETEKGSFKDKFRDRAKEKDKMRKEKGNEKEKITSPLRGPKIIRQKFSPSPTPPSSPSCPETLSEIILEAHHTSSPSLSLTELHLTAFPHPSSFPPPLPTITTSLDVSFNLFASFPTLPFTALETLDLSGNVISSIPPSTLPSLSSLTSLNLAGNHVTTLPPTISSLTSLTSLNLSNNSLSLLPSSLSSCTSLEELELGGNEGLVWEEEGKWAKELKRLRIVECSGCGLKEIPVGLCEVKGLLELDFNSNCLESLPKEIGQLTRLCKLAVMNNRLTDLPVTMGHLEHLIELHLSMNPIKNSKLLEKMAMGTDHLVEWLEMRMTALEAFEKREKRRGEEEERRKEEERGKGRGRGRGRGMERGTERVAVVTDCPEEAKEYAKRKTRLIHGEGGSGLAPASTRSPPRSPYSPSPVGFTSSGSSMVSPSPPIMASPTFSPLLTPASPTFSPVLSPNPGPSHFSPRNQSSSFSSSCPVSHPLLSQIQQNNNLQVGGVKERRGSQQLTPGDPFHLYAPTPPSQLARPVSGGWGGAVGGAGGGGEWGGMMATAGGAGSLYSPMSNSLNSLPSAPNSFPYLPPASTAPVSPSPSSSSQKCDSAIKICKALCVEVLGLCSALQLTITTENHLPTLVKIGAGIGALRDPITELKGNLANPPKDIPLAEVRANGRDEHVMKLVGVLNRTLGDVRVNVDAGLGELGGLGVEDVPRIVGIARALKGVKEGLEGVV